MIYAKEELSQKEWNNALDMYLIENTMTADIHNRMNDDQKRVINEIKKSFKRITLK